MAKFQWNNEEFTKAVKLVDNLMPNALEPLHAVMGEAFMRYVEAAVSIGILHRCTETSRYFAINPAYKAS